jgi:hypothetical protein
MRRHVLDSGVYGFLDTRKIMVTTTWCMLLEEDQIDSYSIPE